MAMVRGRTGHWTDGPAAFDFPQPHLRHELVVSTHVRRSRPQQSGFLEVRLEKRIVEPRSGNRRNNRRVHRQYVFGIGCTHRPQRIGHPPVEGIRHHRFLWSASGGTLQLVIAQQLAKPALCHRRRISGRFRNTLCRRMHLGARHHGLEPFSNAFLGGSARLFYRRPHHVLGFVALHSRLIPEP